MSALFSIINTIFNWINAFLKKRKQDHLQDEYNEIEKNPANWFSNHFSDDSGVRDESSVKDQTTETKSDDSETK